MYPNKLLAKPLTVNEQEFLISAFKDRLLSYPGLAHLYLIGSAQRMEMTDASDLDFVAVFSSIEDMVKAKEQFYGTPRPVEWPCDILWYLEPDFKRRAAIGGVCMIALQDGLKLF